jgi:hypothetical protein
VKTFNASIEKNSLFEENKQIFAEKKTTKRKKISKLCEKLPTEIVEGFEGFRMVLWMVVCNLLPLEPDRSH